MASQAQAKGGLYAMSAEGIDGKKVDLSKYEGKVALIVNTASRCGFTPQYKDLEATYQKYKDKGFVILGFPSNDFGQQEPGTNAEIKKFCDLNYKISFPMFGKSKVTGGDKQPVYKYLTEANDKMKGEIEWNFEKFLVDKHGTVVARYKSKTTPSDPQVTAQIESLLNATP